MFAHGGVSCWIRPLKTFYIKVMSRANAAALQRPGIPGSMIGTLNLPPGRLPDMARPDGEAPAKAETAARTDAATTFDLIERAHGGDAAARDALCARYLPRLQRWAHGRLPGWARGSLETQDLVQDTFIQVLHRLHEFQPRHEGAFHAYLRQILLNKVRDQIRSVQRRPAAASLPIDEPARDPSPLEEVIGHEALERYESALARLKPDDSEAIILRIEMGYPYTEIAAAMEKPSVAAAQMAVSRALVRLAEEMSHGQV
jgi:RNA polymerase sigma factor (sigma-70 family)